MKDTKKNKTNKKEQKEDKVAKEIIYLYEEMLAKRRGIERVWQDINHYVRANKTKDSSNYNKADVYDSTAILAAEYLVSGLWSLINSSGIKWFSVKLKNNKLLEKEEVRTWLEEVNNKMHKLLNDASCGFYYKSYEFYGDLITFGTAVFSITEDLESKKAIFQSHHLGDIFFKESYNKIDTVIRRINFKAKQAVDYFGLDKVSNTILRAYAENSEEIFLFLHATIPSKYFKDEELKLCNMPYSSYYVDVAEQKIIHKSGYYEFPYMIARWQTNSKDIYGQSPAMTALADIKMLNAMSKTMIVAAQKQVDPTILAPNEASVQGIKTAPGGIIYGGIDPLSGNQLIKPLHITSDIGNSYDLQEQRRSSVREAFYHSLLMFMYSNNATATEVLSTNEQKLRLLGAKVARIQNEFLYPLLRRQFQIMKRLEMFSAIDINEDEVEIDFCGAWNKYQQQMDNSGISQIISLINSIQPLNKDVVAIIKWEEIVKSFINKIGFNESFINSKQENIDLGDNNKNRTVEKGGEGEIYE